MKRCVVCFEDVYKGVSLQTYFSHDDIICGGCRGRMLDVGKWTQLQGVKLFVLYEYNDFMERLLFQYKEGRDTALADVFFYPWNATLAKMFKGWTLAYLPSSSQKTQERGFFPLEEMLAHLPLRCVSLFEKSEGYKQSQKSYEARVGIREALTLRAEVRLPPTKILLVDDVCTSGETLLSAYNLIKGHTMEVCALVLCNNHRTVELCDKNRCSFQRALHILGSKRGGVFCGRKS